MVYKFTILGKLPGLNEYTAANRTHPNKGSRMKKEGEQTAMWAIRHELGRLHIEKPIRMHYSFYEPNKKRDLDNISSFAHKVIQDSLVKLGILKNDGWNEIVGYTDQFYCDRQNPRIEVKLEEVENEKMAYQAQ